jgi:hypothetical protein
MPSEEIDFPGVFIVAPGSQFRSDNQPTYGKRAKEKHETKRLENSQLLSAPMKGD